MEAYQKNEGRDFEISCIADNDIKKQGSYVWGRKIIAAGQLQDYDYDYIVIATDRYHRAIYSQLTQELQIPPHKILNYDEFIVMAQFE